MEPTANLSDSTSSFLNDTSVVDENNSQEERIFKLHKKLKVEKLHQKAGTKSHFYEIQHLNIWDIYR
jgi:hypothetical protein